MSSFAETRVVALYTILSAYVCSLITSPNLNSMRKVELGARAFGKGPSAPSVPRSSSATSDGWSIDEIEFSDEEEGGFGPKTECRICQEEEFVGKLEAPCACNGSMKFAHRKCIQQWCNEKKDTTCEICHQLYQPNFTAPPRLSPISNALHSGHTTVDISEGWTVPDGPGDMDTPRLRTAVSSDLLLDAEYDACTAANATGAGILRSLVLVFLVFLLVKHSYTLADTEEGEDLCSIISVLLVRVMVFLMPLCVLIWAATILHSRWQRHIEEAGELEITEVGIMLQAEQNRRGRQFSVGSESEESPHES